MIVGADYYPEHWPRDRWPQDAELMKEAGLQVVRVGEFAWSRFESEPGRIDFAWLDEAISILAEAGISVVMGTPTATPPKWLIDDDPSILQVDRYGRARGFGTRRHYCYSNPRYLEESARIVGAQAQNYAENEAVVAWQIDNEFGGGDTTLCYCENCRQAFTAWLRERYSTVGAMSDAWGTVFWSQEYRSFDDVIVPGSFTHNPGLLLDFQRFSSDSVVSYQQRQIETIRRFSDVPITHNFMGHFADIDYYSLAADLDFVSWDNYPVNQWGSSPPSSIAMAHDITRGTRRQNFWVMEQLSGPCGWATLGPTPKPGQIRLWSYQGVAHGADAMVYFRWRACRFGTEEYWYGILDHDGIPRRRYDEIRRIAREFRVIEGAVDGTEFPADVLLLRSFDNLWSQRFQPHTDGLDYELLLQSYYDALHAYGAQVDISDLLLNLDRYRLVVAPMLNLTRPESEAILDEYVRGGGALVLTFRSGTRTWTNAMRTETIPGPFAQMAGITVEEFDSLGGKRTVAVSGEVCDGTARLWCDVVAPTDAQILATYDTEFYAGRAAITQAAYGKGQVYYVGCDLDQDALDALIHHVAVGADVESVRTAYCSDAPKEVEIGLRGAGERQVLFLLNHSDEEAPVKLAHQYTDILGGRRSDAVVLRPHGVAVLEVSR